MLLSDRLLSTAFTFYSVSCLFFLFQRKKNNLGTLLGWFSGFSALWAGTLLLFRIASHPSYQVLFLLNVLFIISASLIANVFLHLSIRFSGVRFSTKNIWLIYFCSVVVALVADTPGLLIRGIVERDWGRESLLGWGYPLYGCYIIALFLAGLYFLCRAYIKATGIYRARLLAIILATFLVGNIDIFFNLILILMGNYRFVWVGPCGGFVWVSVLGVSILKYSLADIKLALTKTGAFLCTLTVFATVYLLGIVWPYFVFISDKIDIPFLIVSIVYSGLGIGLFFHQVQEFLITTAEKRFLSGKYNTEKILQNLSSQLVYVSDRTQVMQVIGEEFAQSMELKTVLALVPIDSQFEKLSVKWENEAISTIFEGRLKFDPAILTEFYGYKTAPKSWKEISLNVKQELSRIGVPVGSVVLPINSLQQLEGIIILGPKLIEKKYTEQDFLVFSFVINQIMVVFDRITHQEKLKTTYEEVRHLNQELQEKNEELDFKVNEAIALAQKHFHQAALSSLVSGIAHEIRNPMATLLGSSIFVARSFNGKQDEPEEEDSLIRVRAPKIQPKQRDESWRFYITAETFLLAVGGDQAIAHDVLNKLIELDFLTPEGELTDKLNLVTKDLDWIQLGDHLAPFYTAIMVEIKRIVRRGVLFKFLNVLGTQIPRILTITDNMMKYGVSGGGVKKDTFSAIDGFTPEDSEIIFNLLVKHKYLDHKGCVLTAFKGAEPSFYEELRQVLPSQYHLRVSFIVSLIEQSPGAVKQAVNIHTIILGALSIQEGALKNEKILIETEFAVNIPLVSGDEFRLQQAVFNILFNAQQAMTKYNRPDGSQHQLTVKIEPALFQSQSGQMVDGVCVMIQDTGNGMSEKTKKKIFDPFFTTKGPTGGKNIGLGLSILREVVLNHNGMIDVESEENVGTIFKIYLPVYSE